MRFAVPFALLLTIVTTIPALSQEGTTAATPPTPQVPKKAEVPFREDSGLISAEYYLATGKYSQALDVLGGVIQRHPQSADAYTYRGFAFEHLGDLKKAQENYAQAIEIEPTHLGANRYLAGMYLKEGNLDKAMDIVQVIRMTCGDVACQELDEIEADINHYRNGQRDVPVSQAPQHGFVPDTHAFYRDR